MTAKSAPRAQGRAPRVLIVGAGAVGQIYGHCLARSGAEITFYVRERYREEVARGFTIVHCTGLGGRKRKAERFEGFSVVSRPAEVAATRFDDVYLAIPSTGLTQPWLGELLICIGEATLVNLTPSAGDRERILAAGQAPERLVDGFIALVSYPAPLPGERDVPAGTTVWFPPGSPSLFSGPRALVEDVVGQLRRGGMPAKRHPDVAKRSAFLSAAFMCYLLALEAAGWSLAELRRRHLRAATAGARQAMRITARTHRAPPLGLRMTLALAPILRVVLRVAPSVVPFPLEAYLRYHFTKVGAQTRHIIGVAIESGRAAGLPVDALEALLAAAPPVARAA
jgi:Ketopantoate reductase PanE/ApbA